MAVYAGQIISDAYFERQVKKEKLRSIFSHEIRAGEPCQNNSAQVGIPSFLRRNYNQNNCADECAKNNTRCGYILQRKSPVLLGRRWHIHSKIGNLKNRKVLSTVVEEMAPTQGDELAHRRSVSQLARHLRCHCDKILDSSIPFVIDSNLLATVTDAIDGVMSNDPTIGKENAEEIQYQDFVMFLSDFFEQTPSLCLTPGSATNVIFPPSIDVQYFRNLQFLELRKVPPKLLCGLNSVKASLKRLKCTRCLDSLNQILIPVNTCHVLEDVDSETGPSTNQSVIPTNITFVWPELLEVDFSFNRISEVTTASDTLEVAPLVEILNLSRNMISVIDDSFTKVLNCLSVLNLNYNKLTIIPPLPPNLKVLLLAHNYITNLTTPSMSFSINCLKCLEMLDLSTNMISDENDLSILRQLSNLKSVAFMGNPLSYLEAYRTTVCSNLNRLALKKSFTLDKKKLSNSEIRIALESMKQPKFVPFIPSDSLASPMTSSFTTGACSTSNRLNQLKSLTQSYDSNSSSLRSSCRKKPKIREIVLDNDEEEGPSISKAINEDKDINVILTPSIRENSSSGSSPSEKSEVIVLETKATIASIREIYGEEYWLLKQAGDKMKKLLKIPDRPVNPHADLLYSKSLPKPSTSSYLDCSKEINPEVRNNKLTTEELLILSSKSHFNTSIESYNHDSTNHTDLLVTATSSFNITSGAEKSADFSESSIFYSCNSPDLTSEKQEDREKIHIVTRRVEELESTSIFDFETDMDTPEIFSDPDGNSKHFRIFQSGNCLSLIVLDNYLYEMEPTHSTILTKWDLKSLKSLQEEHCDSETETVEFSLQFDTMRKQLREKTFVMSAKDFYRFDKIVSPYIEEMALQEFADAMQCIMCNTQFSRAMANKVVKQEKGQPPKEIEVCPNPDCRSEFLVPLDELPLPNNGVLSVEGTDFLLNGPLRSSTPVSGKGSMSIPKHSGQSKRHMEAKAQASSLTTRVTHSKMNSHNNSNSDSIETVPRPATASSSEKSSITVLNTRSDSDIEVLSCDSSSIEVLAKNSADSESDIEVQEAVEVEVVEGTSKSCKSVVMTESTSSGSYADSICTTYEKKLMANMQPICQQLSPRTTLLNSPSTSTSFSSLTSTSTLTTYSCNSPSRTAAVPIRHDYVDFKIDHRLQLFCELIVFKSKSVEEKLIMLTKVLAISDTLAPFLSILIISNRKIYFYKIVGTEGDKPQDWLQKVSSFEVSKWLKLDVLIGRHGVGLDLSGKYYALLFRDSQRTLNFVKFFMGVSETVDLCPMVRDFSQSQKALMSPNPVSYFGILRFAVCDNDKSYTVAAIVLTDEELMLLGDLGWLAVRSGSVTAKHTRHLSSLRQVESLESDPTFVRLVIEAENYLLWEFLFETEEEKDIFVDMLKAQTKNIPFISLSQPIEP